MKLSRTSLLSIAALVMALTMAIGGTLAYLTDTDAEVNTFTVGNVEIDLREDYQQNAALVPGIEEEKNAWIVNTGKEDAYVFMTVAVPTLTTGLDDHGNPICDDYIFHRFDEENTPWRGIQGHYVQINGQDYMLHAYIYDEILHSGEETPNGLTGITLKPEVDYDPYNNSYKIVQNGIETPIEHDFTMGKVYVNGYAIQAEGFRSAEEAYHAYMGQWFTEDQNGQWSEEQILLNPEGTVNVADASNPDELVLAIESVADGGVVRMAAGDYDLPYGMLTNRHITFEGNGDVIMHLEGVATGQDTANADLTFKNMTVRFSDTENYKGIQHASRLVFENCEIYGKQFLYAENVEFYGCEFENYEDYCVWTYGAKRVLFDGCYFRTGGKAILVYNEDTNTGFEATIEMNNCGFSDNGNYNEKDKAAVETGSNGSNTETSNKYNLIFRGCWIDEHQDGDTVYKFEGNNSTSPFWGNKDNMDTDHLNVSINDEDVY